MKKIQDIIGLPLVSIDEATELGEVKDILIDPQEGKVKYLLIMDHKWYLGGKVISLDRVLSIGGDVITIRNREDLKKFCEVEDAMELAQRDIKILGAKAFTEKGRYIGTVREYNIGEDGAIFKFQLDGGSGSVTIEDPKIISFGTKALVVEEFIGEERLKDQDEGATQPKSSAEDHGQFKTSAELFEEKQRQFLVGRKAKKRILDQYGDILLEEGQILTHDELDRVTDKNKIIELTINTI